MTYLWNRAWCGGRGASAPRAADQVLFVGAPEDVAARSFGSGLPNRREYARRHYRFLRYVFEHHRVWVRSPIPFRRAMSGARVRLPALDEFAGH